VPEAPAGDSGRRWQPPGQLHDPVWQRDERKPGAFAPGYSDAAGGWLQAAREPPHSGAQRNADCELPVVARPLLRRRFGLVWNQHRHGAPNVKLIAAYLLGCLGLYAADLANAAQHGNWPEVRALVAAHAEVNATQPDGM